MVAQPTSGRPAANAVDPANSGLLAAASPPASLGPHGDDITAPSDLPGEPAHDVATEPPVDRSVAPTGPRDPAQLTGYRWPIVNARITNRFGKGAPGSFVIDGVTAHDGLDLSTFCGDRIVAAHDGVVLATGRRTQPEFGWVGDLTGFQAKMDAEHAWRTQAIAIVVDDGNGYRSVYVHLARAVVRPGDEIAAGQLIGYEGSTGNSTGCHLHYSVFSPREEGTWQLEPAVAKRSLLPDREIARIDPLTVLPPLDAAGITWGWGVAPQD